MFHLIKLTCYILSFSFFFYCYFLNVKAFWNEIHKFLSIQAIFHLGQHLYFYLNYIITKALADSEQEADGGSYKFFISSFAFFSTTYSLLLAWPSLFTFINFGLLLENTHCHCSPLEKLINGFHFSRSQCQKCVFYLVKIWNFREATTDTKGEQKCCGAFKVCTTNQHSLTHPQSSWSFKSPTSWLGIFGSKSFRSGERSFNIFFYYSEKFLGNKNKKEEERKEKKCSMRKRCYCSFPWKQLLIFPYLFPIYIWWI